MKPITERLPALAHRHFRNYQLGNFVSNVGNRMQFFAILVHVYDLTHNNAYVGGLGLVRVLPLVALGLFGGVIADHFDRRKVLLISQVAMALVAAGLALTTIYRLDTIWTLYLLVLSGAIANAFNGPVRQAMIANLVPARDFPNAASINGITWRLSDLLGPTLAGLLIASRTPFFGSLAWVYIVNAVSFAAVIWATWTLPPRPPSADEQARTFGDAVRAIKQGFAFFRQTPVVRNTMTVDFWATFFAGAEALIPSFAHEVLGLGGDAAKRAAGLLASSMGGGALLASLGTALMPTMGRQGLWVLRMIALFGLATILFGISPNFWTAAVSLALIGAADMVSTVLRQTIRQLSTPDHMRGRLGSIGMIFQVSGPQLGDAEAGFLAQGLRTAGLSAILSVRGSIISGGVASIAIALWYMARSHLPAYDRHVEGQES